MLKFTITFFILIVSCCAAATAAVESDSTVLPQNDCPQDIKLFKKQGVTSFPETEDGSQTAPIKIISQDASSVTVELRQQWFPSVDSIYYTFLEDKSKSKSKSYSKSRCYEEMSVNEGDLYDTITIECTAESPWADLEICLSDDISSEHLLEGDDATLPGSCHKVIPGCCYEDAAENAVSKPTVCYSLQIRCESLCFEEVARNRGLRGLSSK
jgi:hypothetical protein